MNKGRGAGQVFSSLPRISVGAGWQYVPALSGFAFIKASQRFSLFTHVIISVKSKLFLRKPSPLDSSIKFQLNFDIRLQRKPLNNLLGSPVMWDLVLINYTTATSTEKGVLNCETKR